MTRHSRTQNETARNQNKEQVREMDSRLNKILVFSDTDLKIIMMNIFREIDQNGKYEGKIPTLEFF